MIGWQLLAEIPSDMLEHRDMPAYDNICQETTSVATSCRTYVKQTEIEPPSAEAGCDTVISRFVSGHSALVAYSHIESIANVRLLWR